MAGNTKIVIDTVGLGIQWNLNETYRVAIDQGFVEQEGGLRLPLNGNTNILSFTTWANPPAVRVYNPPIGTRMANSSQTIGFTIDRKSISSQTPGNIYLYRSAGNTLIKTFPISNASITSGNVINLSIIGNIDANTNYYVTANANIFIDRDGYKYPGISSGNVFYFTSPYPPTIQTLTPANASIAANSTQSVVIQLDRQVYANVGSVYLYNANTNALVNKYDIGSNVNVSNTDISIDITDKLDNDNYYFVRTDANIVYDNTILKFPGITSNTSYLFRAPVASQIVSVSPTNDNLFGSSNLTIRLDRTVFNNSGNIQIFDANTNAIVKSYTISTNASINGANISASIYGVLQPLTSYYVKTNNNPVKDISGIKFPGITQSNVFAFTTPNNPSIINTYPVTGNVSVIENETAKITLDQTILMSGDGNVYLKKTSNNEIVKTFTINNTSTSQGNVILDIKGALDPSTAYHFTSDANSIQNIIYGFKAPAITSNTTFAFTTSSILSRDFPNTFILGNGTFIGNTGYTGNTYSLEFRTINSISSLSSISGQGSLYFENQTGIPQGYAGGNPLGGGGGAGGPGSGGNGLAGPGKISYITGTGVLYSQGGQGNGTGDSPPANSGFGGNSAVGGASGIVVLRYIAPYTNASATGGTVSTVGEYTVHTFTSSGTFTFTADAPTIVEYLIVAGGGAGGKTGTYLGTWKGGGGGAGGFKESAIEITSGTYTVTVGAGGGYDAPNGSFPGQAQTGGTSSALGISATGGGGGGAGQWITNSPQGGAGGGSGGGGGAGDTSGQQAGPSDGQTYDKKIAVGQVAGNLIEINNYLNGLSVNTVSNVATPYNINYRLVNGKGEWVYRQYTNTGNLISASPVVRLLSTPTITGATLLPGNTSVNIAYTASTIDGGNVVTSYTAVSNIGGLTANVLTSNSGNITVTGLLPYDTTYSFIVYSTNSQGKSGNSNPIIVSTWAAPDSTSAYFPASQSGSYIQTQPSASGTDSWTYEAWVYNTDGFNNVRPIFDTRAASGSLNGWMLRQNSTAGWIWVINGSNTGFTVSTGRSTNSWQHIAIVRSGNNVNLYVNGTSVGSTTTTTNYSDNALRIGAFIDDTSTSSQFSGYIDEVRVSNIARYTSGFTPPITRFENDSNTMLLLHMKGNGAYDSSDLARTVTTYGNISISSTQYKF